MRAPLTRAELELGLAVIARNARITSSVDDVELLRIGLQVAAAREAAADLAPENPPRGTMVPFIRAAMLSGDRARLEHAFALCVSAVDVIHDVHLTPRATREVEAFAADLQRQAWRDRALHLALETLCSLEPHQLGTLPRMRALVERELVVRDKFTDYARALDDRGISAYMAGVLVGERARREGRP